MAGTTATSSKLVIIDTDCGVDDANALAIALTQPTDVLKILAVTTVQGNSGAAQSAKNVCRLLKVTNRFEVPVFVGAEHPLASNTYELKTSEDYHGKDGLGDVPQADPVFDEVNDNRLIKEEHAALALIRLTREFPGEICIICLGPLSNIALALKLDYGFRHRVRELWFFGGTIHGIGNVTPCAEYNFYRDPEAANVVLTEMKCPLFGLPWEMYFDCSKNLSEAWTNKLWNPLRCNRLGRFLIEINRFGNKKAKQSGGAGYAFCDELAVCSALFSDQFVQKTERLQAHVELGGKHTRGQIVLDRVFISDKEKRPNLTYVTLVDVNFIMNKMMEITEN